MTRDILITFIVIPAEAGIRLSVTSKRRIPVLAGMIIAQLKTPLPGVFK
jgi:hypothetical protein